MKHTFAKMSLVTLACCGQAGAQPRASAGRFAFCAAGGTASAITCAADPQISALGDFAPANAPPIRLSIRVTAASTGATTLAVNGTAAKALTAFGGTALIANDLKIGQVIQVSYNATGDRYELDSLPGNAPAGGGSLPSLTSVGYCFITRGCMGWSSTNGSGALTGQTANKPYLLQIVLPFTLRMGTQVIIGAGGGDFVTGIYDDSGALIANTSLPLADGWAEGSRAYTTPVTLSPTIYRVAWASSTPASIIIRFSGPELSSNPVSDFNRVAATPILVSCANNATGSGASYALPATCGTQTRITDTQFLIPQIFIQP